MNVNNEEMYALRTSMEYCIHERNALLESIRQMQEDYDKCDTAEAKNKLKEVIDHNVSYLDILCGRIDGYMKLIEERL